MRRALIWIAAGVVVVANAWALLAAWQNRRDPRGGTVELTERELRLVSMPGESTVTMLDLKWDVLSEKPQEKGPPRWLDEKKLAELGFDCAIPVTSPIARQHYGSIAATPVFLVLEYQGEAWRQAHAQRKTTTRLFVVDAGRDARRLRERYPDTARHILARGLVRPFYQDREGHDDTLLAVPRLRGWIQVVSPGQIFVPRPHNRLLEQFQSHDLSGGEEAVREPRFAVTVSWGANYEPWVTAVRQLAPKDPPKKAE
jgi:hypothetical protein